jgi:thioredoxin reductase
MKFDVIVIGGSFAGLSASMQLGRARRRVALIDAATPRNRFSKASHGFLGQDGRKPRDIVATGRNELARYPTVELIEGEAISAAPEGDIFRVGLRNGDILQGARVILATGIRDELPVVSGLAERWGISVVACPYCDGYEYGDRALGVLAAGPLSAHQAMLVADWGPTTLFTQGVHEPDAEQLAALSARGVRIERSAIAELLGPTPALEAVRLADGREVPLSALFIAPKTHIVSDLPAQLGCTFENGPTGPYIQVDDFKLTSVKGVYAAGDVASPMPNATFASASGVLAGVAAHRSLIFG